MTDHLEVTIHRGPGWVAPNPSLQATIEAHQRANAAVEDEQHNPEEVLVMFVRVPYAQMADKADAEAVARELMAMINEVRAENGGCGGPVEVLFATRSEYVRNR